jgi:hypothetical protein
MEFQKAQAVDSPELIDRCYKTLHRVIRKSLDQNQLIKQEDWIAVCTHENICDSERMLRIIHEYGYSEFTAASWYYSEPIVRLIKEASNPEGRAWSNNPFQMVDIYWYVLFGGTPDWLILLAPSEDFWIIVGKPDFVEKMLGLSSERAYIALRDIVAESRYVTEIGRSRFEHLIHQLQIVYPAAKPGEAIDFWPL